MIIIITEGNNNYFLERDPPIGTHVFAPMSEPCCRISMGRHVLHQCPIYLHALYHCPISSAIISLCANRMCQILSLVSIDPK